MTAKLLADVGGCRAFFGHWRDLIDVASADGVDHIVTDCPYSQKTHAGHDAGVDVGERALDFAARLSPDSPAAKRKKKYLAKSYRRKALSYGPWSDGDVRAFVEAWAPLTRGWIVSLTDHVLWPAWASALTRTGRYVFPPLACVEPGSRVRMAGDGPAQWSVFACVARPRSKPYSVWGALPGYYAVPPGRGERAAQLAGRVVGGKPLDLMAQIVADYSRPGDLVCDPCMGAATTGVACVRLGRRFVGGDALKEHAAMGAERLRAEAALSSVGAARAGQAPLFTAS